MLLFRFREPQLSKENTFESSYSYYYKNKHSRQPVCDHLPKQMINTDALYKIYSRQPKRFITY